MKRSSGLLPMSCSTILAVEVRSASRQRHAEAAALGRVHGGFLELGRQHFAEALEAADFDLAPALEFGFQQFVLVLIIRCA